MPTFTQAATITSDVTSSPAAARTSSRGQVGVHGEPVHDDRVQLRARPASRSGCRDGRSPTWRTRPSTPYPARLLHAGLGALPRRRARSAASVPLRRPRDRDPTELAPPRRLLSGVRRSTYATNYVHDLQRGPGSRATRCSTWPPSTVSSTPSASITRRATRTPFIGSTPTPPGGGGTGRLMNELWSFIPPAKSCRSPRRAFDRGTPVLLDGPPVVKDTVYQRQNVGADGTEWHTSLAAGFGHGQAGYYALDVTDPNFDQPRQPRSEHVRPITPAARQRTPPHGSTSSDAAVHELEHHPVLGDHLPPAGAALPLAAHRPELEPLRPEQGGTPGDRHRVGPGPADATSPTRPTEVGVAILPGGGDDRREQQHPRLPRARARRDSGAPRRRRPEDHPDASPPGSGTTAPERSALSLEVRRGSRRRWPGQHVGFVNGRGAGPRRRGGARSRSSGSTRARCSRFVHQR